MIEVYFNGARREIELGTTLEQLLSQEGVDGENCFGLAVACSGAVVPHAIWRCYMLQPEEEVDLLYAVQGG